MANRFVSPEQQFINFAGQPYAGGQLFFYVSGTSTPTPTYQDQALTIPNSNPVVLDSAGNAGNIFLNSSIVYKVVLEDVNNNVIWTFDPVIPTDAASGSAASAIVSCTANGTNAITLTPINASQEPSAYANYQVFAFVPAITTTGAVTAQVGSLAFFPVFTANGVQANANDFVAGAGPYFIAYGSVVAGTSPGFLLLNPNSSGSTVPITAATTVSNVHNNKILQLGGGTFYALTFPAGSTLAANFRCIIVNEETTPIGKGIGGVDIGSFTLYPGQSYQIFNDGGTIRALGGKTLYVVNSVALHVDMSLGNDSPLISDGLSTGARAMKTANAARIRLYNDFDHNASDPSINFAAGTIQESVTWSGSPINTGVFFVNGAAPLATIWQPTSNASPFCWIVADGCVMEFSNFQFDGSNITAAGTAIQRHQAGICDQNSGVGFANFGTGAHIATDGAGAEHNINSSYSVSGSANVHINTPSAAFVSMSGSTTVTISNTPTLAFWYRLFGSGANISLGSSITYSGAAASGCQKWFSGPGSVISFSGGSASVPGNINGAPATASVPTASTGWANA